MQRLGHRVVCAGKEGLTGARVGRLSTPIMRHPCLKLMTSLDAKVISSKEVPGQV